MLEKLLKKLVKLPLKDVKCEFEFRKATQEQFDAFKKSFNIKTKVPDWMKDSYRMEYMNEEGTGYFQGMRVQLSGPESRNPKYERPYARDPAEIEREENLSRLGETTLLLWEAILKDVISFDRDKMIAWFKTSDRDWDIAYGRALKYFGKIEKTECCK